MGKGFARSIGRGLNEGREGPAAAVEVTAAAALLSRRRGGSLVFSGKFQENRSRLEYHYFC